MTAHQLLIVPVMAPLLGAVPAAALRGRPGAWVALTVAVITLGAAVAVLAMAATSGPQVYWIGGWPPPYGIVLVADTFSAGLAVTTAVVAVASALHTAVSGTRTAERQFYHPLFLLLLGALGGVFLTGDLFNLYVFMEMVILSSFALVAMADRPVSAETTFKYAVLSALGSFLLLLGVVLMYAGAGTLNLAHIAAQFQQGQVPPFWPATAAVMLAAFLLKGAVFPFHFWQPDAHSAAPSAVSAMLSGILVKIGFYGVARLGSLAFPEAAVFGILAPLGAVSAVFGSLAAFASANLKRLLAYSTIANMGFILLALGWGGPLGVAAAIVNAVNHALIKASLFLSGGYLTERAGTQDLARLGGIAGLTGAGTAAFGLGAAALAGLPPLNGFLSKLTLLRAGLEHGDAPLLAAAVAASALGIAVNLRAFVLVFWGALPDATGARWQEGASGGRGWVAPLALVSLCVLIGVWPGPLLAWAAQAAHELGHPAFYIEAVLGGRR